MAERGYLNISVKFAFHLIVRVPITKGLVSDIRVEFLCIFVPMRHLDVSGKELGNYVGHRR